MPTRKKLILTLTAVACSLTIFYACKSLKTQSGASSVSETSSANTSASTPRILVFTKTKGYYHESIPTGAGAIIKLGKENNFSVDSTSDAGYFIQDSLKNYTVVIFLSTTMDVLNGDQQVAFERYIQAGETLWVFMQLPILSTIGPGIINWSEHILKVIQSSKKLP